MCHFSSEQGRTRVFTEAYMRYVAGGNPRRTLLRWKRAICGWTLVSAVADYYMNCAKRQWDLYGLEGDSVALTGSFPDVK